MHRLAKAIGLPDIFLSTGEGGGVIQGSASEAVRNNPYGGLFLVLIVVLQTLVALLAAKAKALHDLASPDEDVASTRLVAYVSLEPH